jgi:hypothetical protein
LPFWGLREHVKRLFGFEQSRARRGLSVVTQDCAAPASLFAEIDQPALGPLPSNPYEFATWKKARVNLDYHVLKWPGRSIRSRVSSSGRPSALERTGPPSSSTPRDN